MKFYANNWRILIFPPQPLFSPMASGWVGGWQEKASLGCISETVTCKMLILGSNIVLGVYVCNLMM